ncbi:MAG: hypothetical protein Kow0013_05120 [Pararhodobacter sp.]
MSRAPIKPASARTRRTKARPRARILPGLAVLFLLAGALRLAAGVTAAMAQDPNPATPAPVAQGNEPTLDASQPHPPTDVSSAADLLLDIRRREEAVRAREAALEDRAVMVAAAQSRLEEQISVLRQTEQELAATMALADRAAEDDITRLVTVFEAMDAEEAAAVFAEMDPEFAAGFLGRLRPETAAAILAGLDPRLAYGLSALIAGRNALVPRE